MKLNVEIYQDKEFLKKCKQLLLNRINEIIKDQVSLKDMIKELVDKYIQRNVIEDMVHKYVDKILKLIKISNKSRWNTFNYYTMSEYIKEKADQCIVEHVKELLKDYTIEIKEK